MKNQMRSLTVRLPGNTELNLTVGMKDSGQAVLDQLCELLHVSQLHLFGLSVIKDNAALFLDLQKKLFIYLPKSWRKNSAKEAVVSLEVQYFIGRPELIVNKRLLKLYFLDLRARVLSSQVIQQEGLYFQLAAYALQAEKGDCADGDETYFTPLDFFPLWVVRKRGSKYIQLHTPTLHRDLRGMSSSEAALRFTQTALTLCDVPLTFYRLLKGEMKSRDRVPVGLGLTGLHIFQMLNGRQQILCDLPWSAIHSVTVKGKKFEICGDGFSGRELVFYCPSALHAKHLLQHISNSHRLHLNTSAMQLMDTTKSRKHREMYISDGQDPDVEDEEDDLPPLNRLLADFKRQIFLLNLASHREELSKRENYADFVERDVDESEEMYVDAPEDIQRLVELEHGVTVDDFSLPSMSYWKGLQLENV